MKQAELSNNFSWHPPESPARQRQHDLIRTVLYTAASVINQITPQSAEQTLAICSLETAMNHANSAAARYHDATIAASPEDMELYTDVFTRFMNYVSAVGANNNGIGSHKVGE